LPKTKPQAKPIIVQNSHSIVLGTGVDVVKVAQATAMEVLS